MLIEINFDTGKICEQYIEDLSFLFSEVLRSSILGFNLIVIRRDICTWAIDNLSLNRREQSHLLHLKNVFSQNGSLVRLAKSKLTIELGTRQLEEISSNNYIIGHVPILRSHYLEKPLLLIEHIENDGTFFSEILHGMRREQPVKEICFQPVNGGGATITACFREELKNQKILVTVIDSDKLAPCDGCSTTMSNLRREAARQTYLGIVCETPCREIENFIPFSLLYDHRGRICPNYNCFEKVDSILNNEVNSSLSNSIWLYFDIKEGATLKSITSKGNDEVKNWLFEKYKSQISEDEEFKIDGFGPSILNQFLRCGEAVKDFSKFTKKNELWKNAFSDFFELIYWHFVSSSKSRIG
nr:hypothetical protein [uncultured Cohaesibacter sp.]